MLSLELSVNVVALGVILVMSGFAGFVLRRRQMIKIRTKLHRAENEIIKSHTEILELQKEYLSMEEKLSSIQNPVVAMNSPLCSETGKKLPNVALRKKILTNGISPTHTKAIS